MFDGYTLHPEAFLVKSCCSFDVGYLKMQMTNTSEVCHCFTISGLHSLSYLETASSERQLDVEYSRRGLDFDGQFCAALERQ
jgi:hypothetical protein